MEFPKLLCLKLLRMTKKDFSFRKKEAFCFSSCCIGSLMAVPCVCPCSRSLVFSLPPCLRANKEMPPMRLFLSEESCVWDGLCP